MRFELSWNVIKSEMEKDLGTKDFSVNVRNCIISSSLQFFFFFYYYLDLDIKLGYFLKNNRCYAQINLSFIKVIIDQSFVNDVLLLKIRIEN